MDIFATQIAGAQKGALSGGNSPLTNTSAISADFWSVILGNSENQDLELLGKDGTKNQSVAYNSDDIKNEKANLALLQLALLGQSPDGDIEAKLAELKSERLDNRAEQLTKLVSHLTQGLPSISESGGSIETLVANLEKRLENLEATIDAFRDGLNAGELSEDAPFAALIATGLNPNQLTTITSRIQEVEEKLGRELTVEDLIAGVGNIIPAPGADSEDQIGMGDYLQLINNVSNDADKQVLASHLAQTKNAEMASTVGDTVTPLDEELHDLNEELNETALIGEVAAQQEIIKAKTNDSSAQNHIISGVKLAEHPLSSKLPTMGQRFIAQISNLMNPAEMPLASTGDNTVMAEEGTLKAESQMKNSEFNALFGKTFDKVSQQGLQVAKSVLAALTTAGPSPKALENGMPFTSGNSDWLMPIADDLSLAGFDINTGLPHSNLSQAVHASTATPQAGQPHPATQAVMVTMNKAAATAQANEITIQLNPGELGKVKIKLEFGQDNSVKAHLVVEKPETLLMLQRDASALEKSLQDAGLETDGSSLSFEMAQDGNSFSNDRENDPNFKGNGENSDGEELANEDGMVIATTMTWDVDPETGHVHYNILA